jgi:HEAT repeat protein
LEQAPDSRKPLKDPAPAVRLRAALPLAEARDPEAILVLIDLLATLPAEQRQTAEDALTQLAGEWAPALQFQSEDEVSRRIRRDAWASWWRNTDGPALLAAIRKHVLSPEKQARVRTLLAQLGSEEYAARENASKELFEFGRIILPHLREAAKNGDLEIRLRTTRLIERIEQTPNRPLPIAAIRLLTVRKPAGSVESLLTYLPFAEDDVRADEVRGALAALALRDGKPDPALLEALTNTNVLVRSVAAEALIQGGGSTGRAAARKLVKDTAPQVRMRVALALALVKDREGVGVLIDLLAVLPASEVGIVEDALYQLAGEGAPQVPTGTTPAERQKCRDAWAAWWKTNGERVDLARLISRPSLGYVVICDAARVYEIDRNGKERWAFNVQGPIDAAVVPGNHVLVAEWHGNRVTERDFKGNVVWEKKLGGPPTNAQRLPNGNTFIAVSNGALLEVDRKGKEIYSITPGGVTAAYRSRKGAIVCFMQNGQCAFLDTTGKQLKSFNSKYGGGGAGCIDLSPGGNVLITHGGNNKVVEYDSTGKVLRELDAPNGTTASYLPNGHVLVSSQGQSRVFELDRASKTVWERKGVACYRARRR